MGEEPQGVIMYTPDGYMSAQLMHPGLPKFASGDWFRGTVEEIKEEALGYIALDVRVAVPELAGTCRSLPSGSPGMPNPAFEAAS